ncbi:glycosyltransferase [Tsukamurella sp. 8F]|uniref:glycosyltransferase n=1 Tax=unclassified Tsukamurella TaxID=2633480 RepID=UPI0023BA08B1|nr:MULTISPECIES: glycosyltransferase [unclassified Tsukamurella]MDF0530759.1 glycosyltransferase [Tsukamurella sp. 8J]MDF0587960.1 glycosyltransferase [Tsukamurella sp. 8F]
MAYIVIASWGSRGDITPLCGLAQRLQRAGHEVVMTAPTPLTPMLAERGIRALGVDHVEPTDDDLSSVDVKPLAALRELVSPGGMRALGRSFLAALAGEPADLVLLSPFAELAGHAFAESRGIPTIGVRLQPMSATAAHTPALMGGRDHGAMLNRAAGHLGSGAVDALYRGVVTSMRRDLGLSPVSARRARRIRTESQWPVLHGYSASVSPRPDDWRSGLDVTGYWWTPRPEGWEPADRLTRFLEAGEPPVLVSFGSLMMPDAEKRRVSELVSEAVSLAGVRGLVQSGWAGLQAGSADVMTIGDTPYDWLFPRLSAVVHACGAGTAASALRAGIPTVAIPEPGGDQPFWAARLEALGASSATLSRRRATARSLADAIERGVSQSTYRSAAATVAERLADEDGAGVAVARIEECLAERG